ncbi:MAG: DNA repair protein RadC [Oleiphilaceae bacterium]|nr:DNA repair protein RadC [Oleiphilaceae bacterium]
MTNHWPGPAAEQDQPRERLLRQGVAHISHAELVAVLLGTGRRGVPAVELARQLLVRHGSLRALLERSPRQLCQEPGLGPARAARLAAAVELGRRCLAETLSRDTALARPSDAGQFLSARLRHYRQEVFACLFLDNRHRVVAFEELFRGTIDGAAVYPREVVRQCLEHNAAAVILAHNHPSGVAEPSEADRAITRRLGEALALVDVRVLDHLVIGDGHWSSLAERGWL